MSEVFTLITGASSGFGSSIARKLSASQRLILGGRNEERLNAVRESCNSSGEHRLWVYDLQELDGIGASLTAVLMCEKAVIEHFVHSAGIMNIQMARAHDMTCVSRMFNVNLFSAMEIIRPLTQKRVNKSALRSITLISSIASRVGATGYSAYAATKGAVNAYSLSLAVELAPSVRVNSVLPGIIGTEMNTEHFTDPAFVDFVKTTHPLGLGKPEDVADAVDFLVSGSARWITGQEIVVDGGRCVFAPPHKP